MPLMARISPRRRRSMVSATGSAAFNRCAIARFQPDARTTAPAGIGLRVKAAIERVVVFGLALGAHGKDGHRGLRPVVGNAAGDGEARSAVGAVEKRIAVAAVGGIKQFAKAVGAGGGIGGNAGAYLSEHLAGDDAEAGLTCGSKIASSDGIDARQRRSFGGQTRKEARNAGLRDLRAR